MATSPAERLAALLAGAAGTAAGSFSARRTAPPDGLHIEVRGVGPLPIPVPPHQARSLREVARPARYGRGTQTLIDPQVRDTWEIPLWRVKIDQRRWNKTLLPVLDRLRADLGVPDGCRLKPQLHSMLMYTPGQFFVPHQDSEKVDDMVATLVVTLPTTARGGSLIVEHGGQRRSYRSSDKALALVAFYADCRHEVRPVRSGSRIALTYNLVLIGDTAAAAGSNVPEELRRGLVECLNEHFAEAPAATTRLVYLLDHEYTSRALGWARLKGEDSARVSALRSAAARADYVCALALTEVHETWDAYEPEWGRSRRWERHDQWDDDEPGEEYSLTPDAYELGELIDSEISLGHWLVDEPGASVELIGSTVGLEEVCASTPTADLTPYAAEYEGNMGNYGNTMDRWYHRGAVVVWPRRNNFAIRARAFPGWGLDELAAKIRQGQSGAARETAAELAPFWEEVTRARWRATRGPGAAAGHGELFTSALTVADGLDDSAPAAMLLHPFRVEQLTPQHAVALARLADRYGQAWLCQVLDAWFGREDPPWMRGATSDRLAWITAVPGLCAALYAADGTGRAVAGLILDHSWTELSTALDTAVHGRAPSHREEALEALAEPIASVLGGAATFRAGDVTERAVAELRSGGDELVHLAVRVLQAASLMELAAEGTELNALSAHCSERLTARAAPPRAADDWSIAPPPGCDCELCQTLAGYLAARGLREFEWPLAQQKRQHVHHQIDAFELPVSHRTRRSGRPYTLVLRKTAALFELEATHRRRDEEDLGWLRQRDG